MKSPSSHGWSPSRSPTGLWGAVGCHGVLSPSPWLSIPWPSPALGCTYPRCRGGFMKLQKLPQPEVREGWFTKRHKYLLLCICSGAAGIHHPPALGAGGLGPPPPMAGCGIPTPCPCPGLDPQPGWGDSAPRLSGHSSSLRRALGTWLRLAPKPLREPPRECRGMSPPCAGWATRCRFLHA